MSVDITLTCIWFNCLKKLHELWQGQELKALSSKTKLDKVTDRPLKVIRYRGAESMSFTVVKRIGVHFSLTDD